MPFRNVLASDDFGDGAFVLDRHPDALVFVTFDPEDGCIYMRMKGAPLEEKALIAESVPAYLDLIAGSFGFPGAAPY
jgi:hypothetical protein